MMKYFGACAGKKRLNREEITYREMPLREIGTPPQSRLSHNHPNFRKLVCGAKIGLFGFAIACS
jgi:hypothetical protein